MSVEEQEAAIAKEKIALRELSIMRPFNKVDQFSFLDSNFYKALKTVFHNSRTILYRLAQTFNTAGLLPDELPGADKFRNQNNPTVTDMAKRIKLVQAIFTLFCILAKNNNRQDNGFTLLFTMYAVQAGISDQFQMTLAAMSLAIAPSTYQTHMKRAAEDAQKRCWADVVEHLQKGWVLNLGMDNAHLKQV